MEIIRDFQDIDWSLRATVLGVGTFDGMHLAHQRLVQRVVARARETGVPAAVMTFEPLPLEVLGSQPPGRLGTLERRLEAIEALGADHALVVRFDRAFARTKAREFVEGSLLGRLGVREVHVGFNFTFGHGARGTPDLLTRLGNELGFETHVLGAVSLDGTIVSSSAIRALLGSGQVEAAARMLCRPYVLDGTVESGLGRGRRLGFPTANVRALPSNAVVPGRGVYAGSVSIGGRGGVEHPCVINVGVRPTFGGTDETVEAHLLDFDDDLLGSTLRISFRKRLREERPFASAEELAAQIARDVAAGRGLAGQRAGCEGRVTR